MTILYALVARGNTVLAEYTFTSGNFPTITRVLLGKIPEQDGPRPRPRPVRPPRAARTVAARRQDELRLRPVRLPLRRREQDDVPLHGRRARRRARSPPAARAATRPAPFARRSFKRRVPFAFLDDGKNRFFATYGDKGQAAIAFAYNEDFGRTIQKQLEFYNGPQADQFATVHKKLDDVKNVMVQNIEMVLERGEKLELLVDKSEQLQLDSFRFQKSSKKLRQAMFWKKVKIYMLIACVVLVLLYIFLAVLCGPTFEKCGNKDKK